MARADLLVALVKAAISSNNTETLKAVKGIIAEEHAKNHRVLADRLTSIIRSVGVQPHNGRTLKNGIAQLIYEHTPERRWDDIYLTAHNKSLLKDVQEEYMRCELLLSYGLAPRNRIMLLGPQEMAKQLWRKSWPLSSCCPLLLCAMTA